MPKNQPEDLPDRPAKQPKVGDEVIGSHVGVSTAPQLRLRTVATTPIHIGSITSRFITLPRAVERDSRAVLSRSCRTASPSDSRWEEVLTSSRVGSPRHRSFGCGPWLLPKHIGTIAGHFSLSRGLLSEMMKMFQGR